uniref:hypothetical protein n=1 Tax=Microbispora cellulosiformans TaxID=2614688 RepID=UPI0017820D53|nr:hypothetical protein [Microbispora cellulosiformans]
MTAADDFPFDEVEVRGGRSFPYVTGGEWILLAPIPNAAKTLYFILRAHVNRERGGNRVWPKQVVLALLLDLKRGDQVKPYTEALRQIGAVDVEYRRYNKGMRKRIIYTVHEAPPERYAGAVSLAELYALIKHVGADGDTPPSNDRAPFSLDDMPGLLQAMSGQTAGQADPQNFGGPDPGNFGGPDPGKIRGRDPQKMRGEPPERETTRRETTSPSAPTRRPRAASDTGTPRGEGADDPEVTTLVEDIKKLRPGWRRDSIRRVLCDPEVNERPWPVVRAAALAVARDPGSHAPGRLRADGPWWNQTADGSRPGSRPWCGQCHRDTRTVEDPVTRDPLGKCPRCHWSLTAVGS